MKLGQWEKALQETQDSGRLEPNIAVMNSNLAWIQLALNRVDEAKASVEQAFARGMDTKFLRLVLYQAAFLRGEKETMQQQVAWARGRSRDEDWLLSAQSDTEAYFGRLARAREFSQRAFDSALHADAKETAALWQVNAALREAEFHAASARHNAMVALALVPGRDIRSVAALSMARAGDEPEAKKLAESLNKDFPQDTVMQGIGCPQFALPLNSIQRTPRRPWKSCKRQRPTNWANASHFSWAC
jgi:eukaryotic-like serine/threonine-protein kinase